MLKCNWVIFRNMNKSQFVINYFTNYFQKRKKKDYEKHKNRHRQ